FDHSRKIVELDPYLHMLGFGVVGEEFARPGSGQLAADGGRGGRGDHGTQAELHFVVIAGCKIAGPGSTVGVGKCECGSRLGRDAWSEEAVSAVRSRNRSIPAKTFPRTSGPFRGREVRRPAYN